MNDVRYRATDLAHLLELPEPTAEQVRVIEAPLAPTLVVAGAGSGKTETMSARVVYLVANALVRPEEILGLTFTRKAAAELADRIRARLRRLSAAGVDLGQDEQAVLGLGRPTVATYNSYAAALVRDHALRLGVDPDSTLLGEGARWQLADTVLTSHDVGLDTDRAAATLVEAILSLSDKLAEHLLSPERAQEEITAIVEDLLAKEPAGRTTALPQVLKTTVETLVLRGRLMDLVGAYERAKRDRGHIDFADQVALAARLAGGTPAVGAGERARYRAVLLDEYQDTSAGQLVMLRSLFGGGHPVMAVGDPHQSIYGWRGAAAGGLARFPTEFPGPEGPARVLTLSVAWRNDHAVGDLANVTAGPLRAGAAIDLPLLRPRPGAGIGHVEARFCSTTAEEAEHVADWMVTHWAASRGVGRVASRPRGTGEAAARPASDGVAAGAPRVSRPLTAAVLCRARAQFDPVVRALRARGLPVEVVGLGGLLSTPEVVDVVAALQVAHDPSRGDALMRLATSARCRLGIADLHALSDWSAHLARTAHDGDPDPGDDRRGDAHRSGALEEASQEPSLMDAVENPPPVDWRDQRGHGLTAAARRRCEDLARILRRLRSLTYLPVPDLVVAAERALGLDIELMSAGGPAGRARVHVDALVDVARSFAAGSDVGAAGLGAFLGWLAAADEHERGLEPGEVEPDASCVQVLTVHAAKGLEWDVVAVPGLSDGSFPSIAPNKDGELVDSAWLTDLRELPYSLRRDAAELPVFHHAATTTLPEVREACEDFRVEAGRAALAEERRVAYVAFTRARSHLLLTGSWWRGEAARPHGPSVFLREAVDAGCVDGAAWASPPGPEETNPAAEEAPSALWPLDPLGVRREHLEAAAGRVRRAAGVPEGERSAIRGAAFGLGTADGTAARRSGVEDAGSGAGDGPVPLDATPEWYQAEILLAERSRRRGVSGVALPPHLSASELVRLARDEAAFALDLRRPVPRRPTTASRRGTAFHAWVEKQLGVQALLEEEDLFSAEDDDQVGVNVDLSDLQASFRASEWGRDDSPWSPIGVEVNIEIPLGDGVVRCRLDAVFRHKDDGRVEIVDWKTGSAPTSTADRTARAHQLAVYRLAWSRHTDTPLDQVSAAFYYVAQRRTVRPSDLPDAAGLEELLPRR